MLYQLNIFFLICLKPIKNIIRLFNRNFQNFDFLLYMQVETRRAWKSQANVQQHRMFTSERHCWCSCVCSSITEKHERKRHSYTSHWKQARLLMSYVCFLIAKIHESIKYPLYFQLNNFVKISALCSLLVYCDFVNHFLKQLCTFVLICSKI